LLLSVNDVDLASRVDVCDRSAL